MKISVVIATYNGEKYIEEQLESIRIQTRTVDEVLIFDDGSKDETVSRTEKYIKEKQLSGWRIVKNQVNKGWKKNFFDGINEATGDIIFLSDQDDMWLEDKVEKMLAIMDERKDISVLASDFTLQLEGEKNSNYEGIAKEMKNSDLVTKIPFDERWHYVLRPGCTYCFRKTFFDKVKANWQEKEPHDSNLWCFAAARQELAIYHHATMIFRRHGDNASTEHLDTLKKRYEITQMSKRMNLYFIDAVTQDKKQVIREIVHFCDLRMEYLEKRSIWKWLRVCLKYRSYYFGIKSCIADLLIIAKG